LSLLKQALKALARVGRCGLGWVSNQFVERQDPVSVGPSLRSGWHCLAVGRSDLGGGLCVGDVLPVVVEVKAISAVGWAFGVRVWRMRLQRDKQRHVATRRRMMGG